MGFSEENTPGGYSPLKMTAPLLQNYPASRLGAYPTMLYKMNGKFYVLYQIKIYTPLMRRTLASTLEIALRLCCSNKNLLPEILVEAI